MELKTQVLQFLKQPFPLWETKLTSELVKHQWEVLKKEGFMSPSDYSTAGIWLKNPLLATKTKKCLFEKKVFIEMPSHQLQPFYAEHGLELLSENEIAEGTPLLKLNKAFSILRLVAPAYNCVISLVEAIRLLRQPDAEIDLSYSHPQIPFSIFVSVCEDDSAISNLRVAESILHEAMHLKLTLIENIVPLVKTNANNLYYSPWRNEERPVKGVLHGLFVFKAILEFYKEIDKLKNLPEAEEYFVERNHQITREILQLKCFQGSPGLTEAGANLAASLLPLN